MWCDELDPISISWPSCFYLDTHPLRLQRNPHKMCSLIWIERHTPADRPNYPGQVFQEAAAGLCPLPDYLRLLGPWDPNQKYVYKMWATSFTNHKLLTIQKCGPSYQVAPRSEVVAAEPPPLSHHSTATFRSMSTPQCHVAAFEHYIPSAWWHVSQYEAHDLDRKSW